MYIKNVHYFKYSHNQGKVPNSIALFDIYLIIIHKYLYLLPLVWELNQKPRYGAKTLYKTPNHND